MKYFSIGFCLKSVVLELKLKSQNDDTRLFMKTKHMSHDSRSNKIYTLFSRVDLEICDLQRNVKLNVNLSRFKPQLKQ